MTLPGSVPEPPARKRAAWSFRTLVEEVSGRPLTDFQEPGVGPAPPRPRPAHAAAAQLVEVPHVAADPPSPPASSGHSPAPPASPDRPEPTPSTEIVPIPAAATELVETEVDPVSRVYPPLSGSTARRLHGVDAQHHGATLRSVVGPAEAPHPGDRPHPPGPSRRPERIYLHYLLLHLDRLQDVPLRYLKHAVDEELANREAAAPPPAA